MATPGEEIRKARQARHWSQHELAQRCGVGARTIGRIERGEGGEAEQTRTLTAIQQALALGSYANGDGPTLSGATGGQFAAELLTRLNELDELHREVASLRTQVATSDHFEGDEDLPAEDLPAEELAKLGQPPTANGVTSSS